MASVESGTSLAELTSRQVRLVSAPLCSVTELLFESMGNPMGSPSAWSAALGDALEPGDRVLLGPVFGARGAGYIPDCLVPPPEGFSLTFDDELARMVDGALDDLEPELVAGGLAGSGPWALVARHPRRWLDAYLAALRRAWRAIGPLWAQAAPLMEREVERVGVGLARGAFPHVVASLSPRDRVEGDRWFVGDSGPPAVVGDGLVLQPMLIGPGARLVVERDGAVVRLAYPLPGARRLDPRDGSGGSSLEALLGEPRAGILRRIDRPTTPGRLARDMQFSPSAITFHLDALERAELATRRRQGRHVVVRRTARGSALLHLYEP